MNFVNLDYLLIVTATLFSIGMIGIILNRRNILITIISLELILLSVNLSFILYSIFLDDVVGQIFVLFILTVAATEVGIGLALLVAFFRVHGSINFNLIKINNVKM